MDPKEVSLDSEMGRPPICRCLFAVLGSIREEHVLRGPILLLQQSARSIWRCSFWEYDPVALNCKFDQLF